MLDLSDIYTHECYKPDKEVREWERGEESRRISTVLAASNMPRAIIGMILDGRVCDNDVTRLLDATVCNSEIIVLSGDYGTGKTVAACYCGSKFNSIYYISARNYLDLSFSKNQAHNDIAIRARTATNLIVDEFGLDYGGQCKYMEDFVCDRCYSVEKTILTTNLTKDEFVGKYTDRLVSRINHVGDWITCTQKIRPSKHVL